MKLNDQKNYLDQMKWTNCMRRCNKEKQMQEELMSLKTENKLLKKEVDNLADGI